MEKKKPLLTVSGPTTFVGGGIDRNVFRNSGPGLLRDKRLRAAAAAAPALLGFAAKSKPYSHSENRNLISKTFHSKIDLDKNRRRNLWQLTLISLLAVKSFDSDLRNFSLGLMPYLLESI